VAVFKQKMQVVTGSSVVKEALMCNVFGSTMIGAALIWYTGLPNGTWSSFAEAVNAFNMQFANSRNTVKLTSDLFRVVQKPDETLKAYIYRFNREKIAIPHCHSTTAVEAFRQGLNSKNGKLSDELTMYPCSEFEDAQLKALAYSKLEESL
jgi:hypothetical protein